MFPSISFGSSGYRETNQDSRGDKGSIQGSKTGAGRRANLELACPHKIIGFMIKIIISDKYKIRAASRCLNTFFLHV